MAEFEIISQYLPERNEKTEKRRIESCRLRVHFYLDICDQPHKADYFMRSYSVQIFVTLHSFYLFIFIGGGVRNRPECHLEISLKTDQMNTLEFLYTYSFNNTNCIKRDKFE